MRQTSVSIFVLVVYIVAPLMGSHEDLQYKVTSKLPPTEFQDSSWNRRDDADDREHEVATD